MGKVPLPILKELEHQARQNISTLNFTAAFAKTSSSCNASLEKCQHSIKSTVKKIKTQIQKGANPEKAAKRGYEEVCEYMDFWNKTVLIQHRALTCLSKSLAHILQRALYSMANTGLLRREAEMTLLQPQLGEMRRQELRNSSFWDPSLFQSQLVKEGEDFLLKKVTSKDSQGFAPYQNKPFCGPHHKRGGSYRKRPYGDNSSQSSNQSFSSGRGKPNFRGSRGLLQSLTQSTSRRSPPFFQKRLANKQMFSKRVKNYHQWQRTAIPFKAKFGQIPSDPVRVQGPTKRPSPGHLYPVSSVKERNRKGGKCKISRVLQSPVPSTKASPKVEASHRPKQAQHFSTRRKVQNGNSRVHQDLPDSRGVGIVNRSVGRLPTHPHPSKLKEIPQGALEISSVAGQPPSSDRSHCSPPRLVAKSLKRDERCRPSSQRPQYPTLYRRLKQRLGHSLRSKFYKGSVVRSGKRLHINVLELKAVSLALRDFKDQCQNQTVLVAMDNSTVVAYINKQGGTHSAEMCALLWKIMTWCHHYHITLKARHIPGCLNVMADLLSRSNQVQSTEWSLHPQVFKQICQKWFTPHVDLFATHLNHKVPL